MRFCVIILGFDCEITYLARCSINVWILAASPGTVTTLHETFVIKHLLGAGGVAVTYADWRTADLGAKGRLV